MKYVKSLLLLTVAGLGVAGCQTSPLDDDYWVSRRPLGEDVVTYEPAGDGVGGPGMSRGRDFVEPNGALEIHDALAAGLLRNYELEGFAYEVRAAEARTLQAGLRSNPELEVEFENFAGSGDASGADSLETTVAVSQVFPIGGDIERRVKVAQLRGELAGWDYEAARMTVFTEVSQRFLEVLAAQRQVELAQESVDLTMQVLDSISRRVEAGDAPDIEKSRAAIPTVAARVELRSAERALLTARLRLALTWGSTSPEFDAVVGDLNEVAAIPVIAKLVALVNQNPDVARWAVEITARRAEVKLIEAEARPDVTGFVGYRRMNDSDDNALVAGISIPLTFFDKRQGDMLAARLGVASAKGQRRAAELRVQDAIASAYSQLANAYGEVVTLRDEAIPPAEEAYDAIQTAFGQGNLGYLDMLNAERMLIDLKQKYLDALVAYHGAVVEIESLIGQRLDSLKIDAADTEANANNPAIEDPFGFAKGTKS